jgi:RHS repeat-associated protein
MTKHGPVVTATYLSNAMSQRVFKSEPRGEHAMPKDEEMGEGFIEWLRKNFHWMFTQAHTTASIGTAYLYGDGEVPNWAMLGEYDNGSATAKGRSEFVWLPTNDGAIPIGLFRNGQFYAIHTDHLGTSRLMTNADNKPVWQWPYSAFGNNKPTGVLKGTPNPKAAIANQPVLLRATNPQQALDFRFPGQHFDDEMQMADNLRRTYWMLHGRYSQFDPIGLGGGWNGYLYANASPQTFSDPEGLNPALAVYRAGATGYKIGEALNPYLQPTIASALDALLIPDPLGENAMLAQNNKQVRKRIEGLQAQIDEHKKKLEEDPDCDPANHWRQEIKAWEAEIERLRRRLPNGR